MDETRSGIVVERNGVPDSKTRTDDGASPNLAPPGYNMATAARKPAGRRDNRVVVLQLPTATDVERDAQSCSVLPASQPKADLAHVAGDQSATIGRSPPRCLGFEGKGLES
jgi:hypothetical protein